MRTGSGRRSPHRTAVAPIHIDELLAAPGMGGLLGLLEPAESAIFRAMVNRQQALQGYEAAAWRVNKSARTLLGLAEALLARRREMGAAKSE